jgi:hypothetical protein
MAGRQPMSRYKQIEEMAQDICEWYRHGICSFDDKECDLQCTKGSIVEKLVNRGYRKQSEGEWIVKDLKNPMYESKKAPHCSNCGYMSFIRYDYCPNCGAKMKGGEE